MMQTSLAASLKRTTTSNAAVAVIDNPCWGGPTSCSLKDLLQLIHRQTRILLENDEYVVLDKPADLRMDGNYPSTVEKLLQFWCRDETTKELGEDEMLHTLQTTTTPNTTTSSLRHCHQLDYATSGILLFAQSTAAAKKACVAFEKRQVKKTYTALVKGKIDLEQQSEWPVWTREKLQSALQQVEQEYKLQRKNAEKWKDYVPAHALFQKWQHNQKENPTKKRRKLATSLSDESWTRIWNLIDSSLSTQDREIALSSKWKELKKLDDCERFLSPFKKAEQLYNQLTPQSAPVALGTTLPANAILSKDSFAVTTPIATDPTTDGFAMLIPPGNPFLKGSLQGDFKPSVTVATILARCDTATLLRLEPWTGRRHQLRVHCAAIGHAVMGDATYGSGTTTLSAKRLCLHSTSLQIPGIVDVSSEPPFGIHNDKVYIKLL